MEVNRTSDFYVLTKMIEIFRFCCADLDPVTLSFWEEKKPKLDNRVG